MCRRVSTNEFNARIAAALLLGTLDHRSRDVDAHDLAGWTHAPRCTESRSATAATHIEHPLAISQLCSIDQELPKGLQRSVHLRLVTSPTTAGVSVPVLLLPNCFLLVH